MTHTSTKQPDALRLADLCAADWDLVRPHLVVQMLRDLHARIAELEQRLEIDPRHRYDGISARDATIEAQDERIAELEVSQAQRAPLSVEAIAEIAERFEATDPTDSFWVEVCRAFEMASVVGITQEKQG